MLIKKGNVWHLGTDLSVTQTKRLFARQIGGRTEYEGYQYGSIISIDHASTTIGVNNPDTPTCESTLIEILEHHLWLHELGAFTTIAHSYEAPTGHIKSALAMLGIHPSHVRTEFKQIVFEDGEFSFDHGMYRYTVERRIGSGWFTKFNREYLQHLMPSKEIPDDGHLKIGETQSKTFYSTQVGPVNKDRVLTYFGIPDCESTL